MLKTETLLTVFRVFPVTGEVKYVSAKKPFAGRMQILGEIGEFTAVMKMGGDNPSFFLLGTGGNIVGKIYFTKHLSHYFATCKEVMLFFCRRKVDNCLIHLKFHSHSAKYYCSMCAGVRRLSAPPTDLDLRCNSGFCWKQKVASSIGDSFGRIPMQLTNFSAVWLHDGKTEKKKNLLLSYTESVVNIKFAFINDADHRLLLGLPGNRIVLIDWINIKGDSIYRIKQEDINRFSAGEPVILLNSGDLVQFVTGVAGPDGARNLTMLRVYSPNAGCGAII
jgi:hypothetical protein